MKYSLFKLDEENGNDAFWVAAQARQDVPESLKPLILGDADEVGVPAKLVAECTAWLEGIDGWEGGPDYAENPILIQDGEDLETPEGWTIYHSSKAGSPNLHGLAAGERGEWHYQPHDGPIGEVWSNGFATPQEALDACLDELPHDEE
jgi:hypothetical protein